MSWIVHICNWLHKVCITLSSSFPFVRGEVLPATSPPPHLSLFDPPLSLVFFFQSSSSPAFLTSHSPPISALASLVSSCPLHVTLPLSSVVCHPPSFLHVQPTVICSSPVSRSSSSSLQSLPLTPPFFACLPSLLLLFFVPCCFRTLAAFVVVVWSLPRFLFRTGMPVWHKCSWPCPLVFLWSAGPPSHPQLLSTRSLRPVLFDVPLSIFPSLHTAPPRYTKLSRWVSFFPSSSMSSSSLWWPIMCSTSVFSRLSFSACLVNKPFQSSTVSCLPFATMARSSA